MLRSFKVKKIRLPIVGQSEKRTSSGGMHVCVSLIYSYQHWKSVLRLESVDLTALILAPQSFISPSAYVDGVINATAVQDWVDYLEGRTNHSDYIKVIKTILYTEIRQ